MNRQGRWAAALGLERFDCRPTQNDFGLGNRVRDLHRRAIKQRLDDIVMRSEKLALGDMPWKVRPVTK